MHLRSDFDAIKNSRQQYDAPARVTQKIAR
jgi:hypothetical protein